MQNAREPLLMGDGLHDVCVLLYDLHDLCTQTISFCDGTSFSAFRYQVVLNLDTLSGQVEI